MLLQLEIKGHCLIWQRMPRKANENEKSRYLFIMKRDLESILQPTAGCFTDSWIYYGKRRAKTPSGRTKHELLQICIFCQKTTAYKKVHWTRDPLTQSVDLSADTSITEKLLLLQLMTELLALHLVIW